MSDKTRKPGSYAAQCYLAKRERFEALVHAFDQPYPDLARHYIAVTAILHRAVTIAKLSRSTDPEAPDRFIAEFVRLESFREWLRERAQTDRVTDIWPKEPGCTFALKAGSSAMDVICTFAESIHRACVIARALERIPGGDNFWDEQPVHPNPSPAIANWAKLAMDELRIRVIPPDQVWPVMGHIHRDHGVMIHKLADEYERARARAAERNINLAAIAHKISSAVDQYAAYRKRLFLELVELKQAHTGWKIQYNRDPAEGDPTVPPRPIHQTGTLNSIGDVEIDGIATFRFSENYAPFTDLQLLDASGDEPEYGSDAFSRQLRFSFLLEQLLQVATAMARDLDALQRRLVIAEPSFDFSAITRLQLAIPPFPFWPQIKGMTAEKYDAVLADEQPILDDAKVALRRVEFLQHGRETPKPSRPDPNDAYEHCLRVLFDTGYRMEALPSTFQGKGEEALRDHFITVLSSHFQSVTGETFNRSGKTDIFVRHDGTQVLVAECKVWDGPKHFSATIDQVLGYLSWRDERAAVVMFVRNRELTPVLDAGRQATRAHACFVSEREVVNEAWANCVFRTDNDRTRTLRLAVMLFHFPETGKGEAGSVNLQ